MSITPQGRALRPAALALKLDMGLSTVWLKAKTEPDFPKPVKLSPHITIFFEDDADRYLAAKRAAQSRTTEVA